MSKWGKKGTMKRTKRLPGEVVKDEVPPHIADLESVGLVPIQIQVNDMSMKPTLDKMLDKIIYNTAEAVLAKEKGDDVTALRLTNEVARARQDVHLVAGTSLDLSERALLNRAMKG